jgi:hypothetical protein
VDDNGCYATNSQCYSSYQALPTIHIVATEPTLRHIGNGLAARSYCLVNFLLMLFCYQTVLMRHIYWPLVPHMIQQQVSLSYDLRLNSFLPIDHQAAMLTISAPQYAALLNLDFNISSHTYSLIPKTQIWS